LKPRIHTDQHGCTRGRAVFAGARKKLGFIAVEIIFGNPHPSASVSIRGEINIGFWAKATT